LTPRRINRRWTSTGRIARPRPAEQRRRSVLRRLARRSLSVALR
jgi:hypothetical protein